MATVWHCQKCSSSARTVDSKIPHHPCPGFGFMMVPLIPEGVSAKVETNEREDYVGKESVQYDSNGRPIMNVTVTRDDGQDVTVFAPVAGVGVKQGDK